MSNLTAETHRILGAVAVPGVVGPVDIGEPVAVLVGPDLSVVVGVEVGVAGVAGEPRLGEDAVAVAGPLLEHAALCKEDGGWNGYSTIRGKLWKAVYRVNMLAAKIK